jgi:broad specificity phosphatase PhoE
MAGPPQQIVLIRHAEKPAVAAGGIDVAGAASDRCLTPRGWQRAGALATLFAPARGEPRPPLTRPEQLHSPEYETENRTINHRTYETILPLAERLDLRSRAATRKATRESSLATS